MATAACKCRDSLGYHSPGIYHGFKSSTGGLRMELEIGDRVALVDAAKEIYGRVRAIVGDMVRVETQGGLEWFDRVRCVYMPRRCVIKNRRNAIRHEWSEEETRKRAKYYDRPYEIHEYSPMQSFELLREGEGDFRRVGSYRR